MSGCGTYISINEFVGKTFKKISGTEQYSDEVVFTEDNGSVFEMFHKQDCCESVSLEEVIGDIDDLIDSEILLAEEVTDSYTDEETPDGRDVESATWTFYKLSTFKGSVTLRWVGESNGYYSEGVDIVEVEK